MAAQSLWSKSPGKVKFTFGGRLMLDGAYYDRVEESGEPEMYDGTEIRRARVYIAGKMHKNWGFILQYDLAGNKVTIKEAKITWEKNESVWSLGNHLPPFSLQLQTSSKYQIFVTRAQPVPAWNPVRAQVIW